MTPTHHTHNGTKTLLKSHLGLGLFRNLTFQQETFRHGYFISGTFRYEDISAQEHFGMGIFWHHGCFSMGTSWHWNILARGYFDTWTFWHRALVLKCLCLNVYIALQGVKMYMCWNVHVLKYHSAKMSQCCNIPVPKCPCSKKSPCRNVSCLNVRY